MKNLSKIFVILLLTVIVISANAQKPKFGHIDLGALIEIMPERATAEKEFNEFQNELEEVLAGMEEEYNTKRMQLEQFNNTTSMVKRNAKLSEIQGLQRRIENFRATAEQQASQKYQSLLKPIFDKANKAIETVAQQQGLIYVFDSGPQVIMYKSGESIDILPLVKKELGIN